MAIFSRLSFLKKHNQKSIRKFSLPITGSVIFFLSLYGCNVSNHNNSESTAGCPGVEYPEPTDSLYVLPYAVGSQYSTGLTNCSTSFHRAGQPDEMAFDFNLPLDTPFVAARAGVVVELVDDQASSGGGVGNYILIDHGDNTFAYYLHSPQNGFYVELDDHVQQGQIIGLIGRSGQAGYPHLHFIVVEGPPAYPYQGLPISFKNASPMDKHLQTNKYYLATDYELNLDLKKRVEKSSHSTR